MGKSRPIPPMLMEAQSHFVLRYEGPQVRRGFKEAKAAHGDRVCLVGGYDPHNKY